MWLASIHIFAVYSVTYTHSLPPVSLYHIQYLPIHLSVYHLYVYLYICHMFLTCLFVMSVIDLLLSKASIYPSDRSSVYPRSQFPRLWNGIGKNASWGCQEDHQCIHRNIYTIFRIIPAVWEASIINLHFFSWPLFPIPSSMFS